MWRSVWKRQWRHCFMLCGFWTSFSSGVQIPLILFLGFNFRAVKAVYITAIINHVFSIGLQMMFDKSVLFKSHNIAHNTSACSDMNSGSNCRFYLSNGHCSNPSVKKMCRKTCGVCQGNCVTEDCSASVVILTCMQLTK